jgi:hypothetical protein
MQDNRAKRPPPDRDFRPTATLSMLAPTDDTIAIFPAGFPLHQAAFIRHRHHLLVRAAGRADVIVPRFFHGGGQTTLATRDGMEMSRHMVLLRLGLSARIERALDELAVPDGRDF